MKAVFQQQLPVFAQEGQMITDCTILRTQYRERSRRRSSLTACYRLQVTEPCTQRQGEQTLYVSAYLAGRSQQEFQAIQASMVSSPRSGEILTHLPALDMIVWTFPHDPKLPHLPQIMAPERVKYYLPSALFPRGIEDPQELMVLAIESIRYCPADRCTLCCHLQWGSSSGPQRGLLFGKIFNDDRGREIYHQHALLWKKSLENPDGFLVAQPLEYSENAKLMWQQALPGIPLLHIINGINYTTFLAAVAKGLASLHASGLSSPVHIAIQDRLRQIRKRTSKMIQTFPVFQKAVHSIVDDLEHRAMYLTPMPEQLIHGDFHIKQLLVHKGKIGVCDYDDFAMGDPTQDLATFLVDLLFRDVDTRLIHLISIAFFHAYKAHVDWEIPVDRLQWQIHIEIIKKLYRLCFRKFQRRGFAEYIHQIITLVQQEINPETDLGTLASQVAKIRSMQS